MPQRCSAVQTEPVFDVLPVALDGLVAQVELLRHFPVVEAGPQQLKDPKFAIREILNAAW